MNKEDVLVKKDIVFMKILSGILTFFILLIFYGVIYYNYEDIVLKIKGEDKNNEEVVKEQVNLVYSGSNGIELENVVPQTVQEAREDSNNSFTFQIERKDVNTSEDIWYEIDLVKGKVPEGKQEEKRIEDKYIRFELIENKGSEIKRVLTNAHYEDLTNVKIWVNKIYKEDPSNVSYELKMWVSDEIEEDIKDSFVSMEVTATGNYTRKINEGNKMLREGGSNYWPSEINNVKRKISEVKFLQMTIDEINEKYDKAPIKVDLTSEELNKDLVNKNSIDIKCWLEIDTSDKTKYVMNVASEKIIMLPESLYTMFNSFTSMKTINFANADASKVMDTSFMFNSCSSLTSIDLSSWDMSKVYGTTAMFQYCPKIENIKMPNTMSIIDDYTFNHISSYNQSSFVIPTRLTEIGDSHMWYDFGTTNFKEFIVNDDNAAVKTIDGILYTKDGTRLISVPNGKTFINKTFTIPEGVTNLSELGFNRTKQIDKVVFPNSYTISRYINGNQSDVDPTAGNSISISIYVFTSIKEYEVHDDNPNYISKNGCIYSKDGKELIAVPTKYTGILTIPEGTTTIGEEAFWVQRKSLMSNITKIVIPSTVISIESIQLTTLNSLPKAIIEIASGNQTYKVFNGDIVSK